MEFFTSLNVWYKRGIAAGIGGIAGFAYYYYIGCASGTCPITSNPYLTTGYGVLMGYLFIDKPKKEIKESNNGNDDNTATGEKI